MNSFENEKYENRCRACMNCSALNFCTIFDCIDNMESSMTISKFIELLIQKELKEEDALPKTICAECHSVLLSAYNFKLRCEASQKFFEEIWEAKGNKVKIEYEEENVLKSECFDDDDISPVYREEISKPRKAKIKTESKKSNTKARRKECLPKQKARIKNHECHVCNKKFLYPSELNAHIKTHVEKYYCEICKKYYISEKVHIRAKHLPPTLFCDTCGKGFSSKSRLIAHLAKHTNLEPRQIFKCNEEGCTKRFASKHALEHHQLKHSGVRAFLCEICSKLFMDKPGLKLHYEIHQADRSYKCKYCDKIMKSRSSKLLHERKHKPILKMFPCNVCNKEFITLAKTRRHMLVHGVRQFKCPHCPKEFFRKDQMKGHMRRMHTLDTHLETQDLALLHTFPMF